MKLILSHTSALDLIRAIRWRRGTLPKASIKTLSDCASSLAEVQRIQIPAFDQSQQQLEVLTPPEKRARKSKEHVCRTLAVHPISGMFCKIAPNAYVTSPEMTFVQMATRLNFVDLLMLGMELCGTYAPCPYSDRFDGRAPLTTKARLLSFCERASGVHGSKVAAKAARWIVDNSNSPAESALVLFLCLPVRLGGYGFAYPDMNPTTKLGVRASRVYEYDKMRCDLHWVDERVVVEYDSDQEHLSSQSAAQDARRRNTLGYKNTTVITVRKPMIASPSAFDGIARQLAKALGRKLRTRDLQFTTTRSELRMALFPWLKRGIGF